MKHRFLYLAQLLVAAIAGYLLILPWAMTWVTLNDHFIAPIFERWTHCCGMPSGDPIVEMKRIYSVFDSIVAGVFALISSLIIGFLLRVHWSILWVVFCAIVILGLWDFGHSRFGLTAVFMLVTPTTFIFVAVSMTGFWWGSALRKRRAHLTIGGAGREA